MNLTQQKLLKTLESASKALPIVDAPVLPVEISLWVEKLPFIEISAGDEICREFAATQKWPKMADGMLAQIHLRLDAAIDMTRDVIRRGHSDLTPPALLEDALSFLLVDFWHGKGIDWARFRFGKPSQTDEQRQKN